MKSLNVKVTSLKFDTWDGDKRYSLLAEPEGNFSSEGSTWAGHNQPRKCSSGGCKLWNLPGPFFLHVVPLYFSHTSSLLEIITCAWEPFKWDEALTDSEVGRQKCASRSVELFPRDVFSVHRCTGGPSACEVVTQPARSLLHRGAFVLRAMITSADWIKGYGSLDTSELNQQHVWLIINERHIGGAQITAPPPDVLYVRHFIRFTAKWTSTVGVLSHLSNMMRNTSIKELRWTVLKLYVSILTTWPEQLCSVLFLYCKWRRRATTETLPLAPFMGLRICWLSFKCNFIMFHAHNKVHL